MFSISASSLLIRVTPPHQRGQAQGVFAGGFLLGAIAGPALGVVAAWSLRAPFFLYAGTLTGRRGDRARARYGTANWPRGRCRGGVTLAAARRAAQPAYVAALLTNLSENWAIVGVRSAMVPLFVHDRLALGSIWTYIGFFALTR